ncbi:MAG TPA: HD domain-containing protein [Nevskiaceae bacterium]|nr:HD domain-containing protein [Nevskiaceae bacterium]
MQDRYNQALKLAAEVHATQIRKGTVNAVGFPLPYITHPVAVSALVQRYGGTEGQCCAALLHDTLEDGGPQYRDVIRTQFGEGVLAMVEACTDGTPDESGHKAPWKQRKTDYLAHLRDKTGDAVLVSACDKLHNLRSINADRAELGDAVFERFTATKEQTLWYYGELVEILSAKVTPRLAAALNQALSTLRQ